MVRFTRSTPPLPFGWYALVAILRMPRSLYTASGSLEHMRSAISEEASQTPPKRYVLVDQNASGVFSSKLRSRDGVHITRRLNLFVKSRMQQFPRLVTGRGAM